MVGPWILILTIGPPFFGVVGFSIGEPSSQQTIFSAFGGDTYLSKEGKRHLLQPSADGNIGYAE